MSPLYRADQLPDTPPGGGWLIKPFIPVEGIVLLYGKKGVGKSPLTWALAHAVATGTPWLGYPAQDKGIVLYIEVDTPVPVVSPRMKPVMGQDLDIHIYFPPGSIADHDGWKRLQAETKECTPKLVIVNTLRKVHVGDDTKSTIPSLVYSRFRFQWPHACIVFVHHEKKTPSNPEHGFSSGEEFSGSLAWANDAQVVLRLWRHRGRPNEKEGRETILSMTGNQLAPLEEPIRFYLKGGLVENRIAPKTSQNTVY